MLSGILTTWLLTALGLWITTLIVPGVNARSGGGLLWAALALGIANVFIRPLLWVLTLPLTVLSFGLFALVINALMIWLSAALVADFEVRGFGSALLAALVMALLSLAGFILMQWWMGAGVHWISIERHSTGMYL